MMAMRRAPSFAILALLVFLAQSSRSFTLSPSFAPNRGAGLARLGPNSPSPEHSTGVCTRPVSSTSTLLAKGDSDDAGPDPLGLRRGLYLFLIVGLINVWSFSIPPEFRRAQFCSAEQVELNPGSHCITTEKWVEGIADYYKNGGGIHFDFSIEGRE
eukprot:CAMPEP_0183292988 /NCGR_PEP_ID=MMETSP0160_2-20130417/1851_1 /TAXON_ID=2839 ORGANISM="Odontella Sinensis, Strain Grunow 1884" /NCGR_SAMPLE_ID=MMETSP0160_2 /ASSEMBLY_ACC=CAM_ASM_000250 /LENGTH=156 /DNA_ID=CAMNT_0025454039 /DNA_START=39 /DNA_END=509 /DNA_ORIENTATION=+